MAQTGFTPIQIYYSTTPTNVPLNTDLTNGELAINSADGKLFYKDSGGSVQTIAWKTTPVTAGGTGQTTYTDGQLLIGNTTGNTLAKSTLTAGSGITITNGSGAITIAATGGGTGTVTSVGLALPAEFTVTNSPVIASGTLTATWASETANYFFAAPNGGAGTPSFRAIVAADIPALSYIPYTGATSAVDLNAKTLVNVANLGINTTSVPTIRLRAVGDNGALSRIAMRGYSSDANSSSMRVSKFRGTSGAPQAPISGDSLGKFELAGYGTTAAEAYPQVSVEGVTTEIWGATARGAKALIKVTPNTTITQVTAVTVDQDSSVTLAGALNVTGTTTLAASLSGLAKLTSGVVSAATSGTDYAPATSGSAILYGNGAGGFSSVTIGTGVSFAGGTLSATGSGGTVTSVTGTAPVVSSGGTTPAISMAAATTAVNGYLTSTDWTTFNGKYSVGGALGTPSSGTVTNLTGTASININGTVGATTPTTGVFTTATANSFIPNLSTIPTNGLYLPAANSVGIATNSTNRATFDAAGNVGIATTPAAWASFSRVIQLGLGAYSQGRTGNGSIHEIGANSYLNTSSVKTYITSQFASYYEQNGGTHSWYVAPSGIAGDPITFTLGAIINNSGNLSVGTTAALAKLTTTGFSVVDTGSVGYQVQINSAANLSTISAYYSTGQALALNSTTAAGANNEVMRLSLNGGVSIGNTVDPGLANLSVTGTIASASTITATGTAKSSYVITGMTTGATAAGTNQATAYVITTANTEFTTTAAGTGAILPAAVAGQRVFIANDGANTLLVYPQTGGVIDQAAANGAITIAVNGMWEGVALTTVNWTSISPDTQGTANQITATQGNGVVTLAIPTSYLASPPAIGGTAAAAGTFTALSATSNAVGSVTAKAGGLTSVTTGAGSLTLFTGGVTLASQVMASGSVWRVVAYGTYVASSSANARTLTMSCFWGSTALTAVTSGAVLVTSARTSNWSVELEISGSSATAAWCTGILTSQVTSLTIPLQTIATAASVTGLTTTSTLDFRVGQTGTATAGDTLNVHSVVIERIK